MKIVCPTGRFCENHSTWRSQVFVERPATNTVSVWTRLQKMFKIQMLEWEKHDSSIQKDANVVVYLHVCVCRVMAVPATVIYFTCYDQLRDFLRFGLGFQGSHIPLVAGGLARCKPIKGHIDFLTVKCWWVFDFQCVCVCFSGRCDTDQPSGAGQDEDAVPSPVLQRAAGVHPLCCGAGWPAVAVEGLGTHRSQRRTLLWWERNNMQYINTVFGKNLHIGYSYSGKIISYPL